MITTLTCNLEHDVLSMLSHDLRVFTYNVDLWAGREIISYKCGIDGNYSMASWDGRIDVITFEENGVVVCYFC